MTEMLRVLRVALDFRLFEIGGSVVTVAALLIAALLLLITFVAASALSSAVSRTLTARGVGLGLVGTISTLLRYLVLVIGIGVALETAGINLAALFTAGALFAVGLGFAMQSIAQNFVAGVILLVERSIQPGDLLQVEGKVVRVLEIGIRASVARTRDGEDLVIPNAVLIQTTVTNHTLKDSIYRIKVPVGVTYDSDMAEVKEALTSVAREVSNTYAVAGHAPQVIMTEFGNHAVNWEVAIWMNDPWTARPATSALCEAIWWAFHEKGIVIAFPQVDVHFDAPVANGLANLASSAA